jgi:hypothetical protein
MKSLIFLFVVVISFSSCMKNEDDPIPEKEYFIKAEIVNGASWECNLNKIDGSLMNSGDSTIFMVQGFDLSSNTKRELSFILKNKGGKLSLGNGNQRAIYREGIDILSMNGNYFISDSGYVNMTFLNISEAEGSFEAYFKNPNTSEIKHIKGSFFLNWKPSF